MLRSLQSLIRGACRIEVNPGSISSLACVGLPPDVRQELAKTAQVDGCGGLILLVPPGVLRDDVPFQVSVRLPRLGLVSLMGICVGGHAPPATAIEVLRHSLLRRIDRERA
jgi:hypothetical protein